MKKNFYPTLLIIILFSMILFTWKMNVDRKNCYRKINQLQYENNLVKSYFVSQHQLLPKKVIDTINKYINISNNEDGFLIASFSKENCGICMKRLFIDLESFKEQNNFSNILLVSNIPQDEFCTKMEIEQGSYKYIFTDKLSGIKTEFKEYPLLFTFNAQGSIKHLFVPDVLKNYNEKYFDEILPRLIKKKSCFNLK